MILLVPQSYAHLFSTAAHVQLSNLCLWPDVEVEDVDWQAHGRASIGDLAWMISIVVHEINGKDLRSRRQCQRRDLAQARRRAAGRSGSRRILQIAVSCIFNTNSKVVGVPYRLKYSMTLKLVWRYATVASM